jgi:GNAT superfamily N-acetyltransferase
MILQTLVEHAIDPPTRGAITALRNASFPDAAVPRDHYKQLPHWRLLAWDGEPGGTLVGHLGVEHRMVRLDDTPRRIFGVVDLCVLAGHRGRGLAGRLLASLEATARAHGVEALMLVAADGRLYRRHGFVPADARATWLRLHEHRQLGIADESLAGELWIKPLVAGLAAPRRVDWLGHLF